MNYIVEIPFAIDIFDAATYRCLPGYDPGFVDFTREQPTFGSVIYHLRQKQLGDLGSIELHKIHADITALHVNEPPAPEDDEVIPYVTQTRLADKAELFSRVNDLIESGAPSWLVVLVIYELVPPEKAAQRFGDDGATTWSLALPRSEARPIFTRLHEVRRNARKELHDKRKEHQRLVLQAFDNRLREDGFMTVAQRLVPRSATSSKPTSDSNDASPGQTRRRGGRKTATIKEKHAIVEGWLAVQAYERQDVYCANHAISTSTLRRWARELGYTIQ